MPARNIIDTSGIEEDTKQLEWLLKRLVEKLQPLTNENEPAITKYIQKHTDLNVNFNKTGTAYAHYVLATKLVLCMF